MLEPADAFTINAVAQDEFTDVQVPDAPVQSTHIPNTELDRAAAAEAIHKQ